MLSSVLNSERAIEVNILIMRGFIKLREMIASHKELADKLDELDRRVAGHDQAIIGLVNTIRNLMASPEPQKKKIGFGRA